jgi:hypothetical protein
LATHRIAKRAGRLLATTGASPNTIGINYDTDTAALVFNDGTNVRLIQDATGALPDRVQKVGVKSLNGTTMHAATNGIVSWTNPESSTIVITKVVLYTTTVATGACTLDIGTTATTATTTSDNLIDGVDANSALLITDNSATNGSAGTNGKPCQTLASGKWVTIDEKTGDSTGLVGTLYIHYYLA